VRSRSIVIPSSVAILSLLAAGLAWAATPGQEKIALTAAGNAQAKAEVLRHADLGAGWSGGSTRPDLSSKEPCSVYNPSESGLVVVGAAATTWHNLGFFVGSEALVLQTAKMVKVDWQRTVIAPKIVPCLRQGFAKTFAKDGRLVSFGRIAFPHVTRYTAAFRGEAKIQTGNVEFEVVVLGAGRNELTLFVSGPASAKSGSRLAAKNLARKLASRLPR
jgi:hypothetical protein